jgi:glutamate carboxypeptidase
MTQVLSYLQQRENAFVALARQMVECESHSRDRDAVNRMGELLCDRLGAQAKIRRFREKQYGDHLRFEFSLPGRGKKKRILLLGHHDTVWPLGTLKTMPFRKKDGRLWGPGVYDMKGGVAQALMAIEALRELEIPAAKVTLLSVSEEELGSPVSRAVTEAEAAKNDLVIVVEPSIGEAGLLKTARKGAGHMKVTARGVASHSGIDFWSGASAVVELARQVERIAEIPDRAKEITVNPGLIEGGTALNTVAAEATVYCDFRAWKKRDLEAVIRKFGKLKAVDKRCEVEVSGGVNRPALERTPANRKAFRHAKALAKDLGFAIAEGETGGGSDGNFTSAMGIATLDGMGAVGAGAHASHEQLDLKFWAERAALVAALIADPPA